MAEAGAGPQPAARLLRGLATCGGQLPGAGSGAELLNPGNPGLLSVQRLGGQRGWRSPALRLQGSCWALTDVHRLALSLGAHR